jgi:hypothetical protein
VVPNAARAVLVNTPLRVVPSLVEEPIGKPLSFESQGLRIELVSISASVLSSSSKTSSSIFPERVVTALSDARRRLGSTGKLVVFVPASADYGRLATDAERRIARGIAELGADVVVGQGGYAAKEIEHYERSVIAYSLGTVVRPPTLSLSTQDSSGIALRLQFTATSVSD